MAGWGTHYIYYIARVCGKGGIFVVGRGWEMGGRTSRPNLEALTGRKILFVRAIKYLRIRHSVLEVLLLVLAFAYEVLDEVFVVYHQIIYDLSLLSGMCPLPHTVTLRLSFMIYHLSFLSGMCISPFGGNCEIVAIGE